MGSLSASHRGRLRCVCRKRSKTRLAEQPCRNHVVRRIPSGCAADGPDRLGTAVASKATFQLSQNCGCALHDSWPLQSVSDRSPAKLVTQSTIAFDSCLFLHPNSSERLCACHDKRSVASDDYPSESTTWLSVTMPCSPLIVSTLSPGLAETAVLPKTLAGTADF